MKQNNKSHNLYNKILLTPGLYFHHEYNIVDYYKLPTKLQQIHNQHLIRQYSLILPDKKTLPLSDCFLNKWLLLPKIVLSLGILLYTKVLPWSQDLADYSLQHQQLYPSLCQITKSINPIPDKLIAIGAEQILFYLMPFGSIYTCRFRYMFSSKVFKLMSTSIKSILPWNIIEDICQYIGKNTTKNETNSN